MEYRNNAPILGVNINDILVIVLPINGVNDIASAGNTLRSTIKDILFHLEIIIL